MNYETILDEAHEAARKAVNAMGPENMHALDCGFAWVTIDGNDPLARHCRKQLKESPTMRRTYGDKGYPKGWQFWKPGDFDGQAVGHHEAGARAFRDKLAEYGIRADVGSRLD